MMFPPGKRGPIIQTILKKVKQATMVYTDDYEAYARSLPMRGYGHEFVNHSGGEYARGDVHVNNCECASNLYQMWMSKFMGVNKKNLQAYSRARDKPKSSWDVKGRKIHASTLLLMSGRNIPRITAVLILRINQL
jgi:transposase-like protein